MLQKIQPGAWFEVIPGAGHWVQYEAAEEFNRVLLGRLGAVQEPQPRGA
jgi:pimeloyl-ACP methyl ester carboxylesterase